MNTPTAPGQSSKGTRALAASKGKLRGPFTALVRGPCFLNCEPIVHNPFLVLWDSAGPSVGCRRDGLTGTVYL